MRRMVTPLVCALVCAAALVPQSAFAQGALLKLDNLDALSSRAKEAVNVSLDQSMMQVAAGFLSGAKNAGQQGKNIADLVAGLKGIYVRNFEFENEGAYSPQDVAAIKAQLKSPWAAMVTTREAKESVDVYGWRENGQMGGLAIVVAEPRQLTIVNIVGTIDLNALSSLAGAFGVPPNIMSIPGVAPRK